MTNVTRVKKVFFHFGNVVSGSLEGRLGEKFPVFSDLLEGEVDAESRRATERNHTSTHLLHWALREVLGRHCEQSGSLVEPNRLRFDFTHFRQVTPEQLSHIERLVNERIVQDHELRAYTDSLENARKSGVIALFGEKYEDTVRIVDIGGFSKELCGGCHISRTGEIGSLVITGEEAIAAGIRRLTAYTGLGALSYCRENLDFLSDASNLLGEKPERLVTRLETILDENKQLRNELEAVKRQALAEEASDAKPEDIGGVPALVVDLGEAEPSQLRGVMDTLKNRVPGGLMLLAARSKGKVTLLVYVDEPLIKRGFKAGELIRPVAKAVGGGGGGRPNMAQAGGSRPEKLQEAFDVFRKHVEQQAAGS
ncbi:MAG: DHHA1 domain-containing protein [Planctomycetota bacterium]|nr:DHHA1 domain-containing protein [Planctomycetota bacterium]